MGGGSHTPPPTPTKPEPASLWSDWLSSLPEVGIKPAPLSEHPDTSGPQTVIPLALLRPPPRPDRAPCSGAGLVGVLRSESTG